jgi:hypothetical protein
MSANAIRRYNHDLGGLRLATNRPYALRLKGKG